MAGSFADYLEPKILNHLLGGPDFERPATVHLALYTTAPSDAGGGVEVSGGDYERLAVTNNDTNFPAASTTEGVTSKKNGAEFTFVGATADWGTVRAVGILDASENLLAWADLAADKLIESGDTAKFPINSLVFTLD